MAFLFSCSRDTYTTIKRGKSTILEIPVFNNTNHDIRLPKRTVLGRIQPVRSVTAVDVRLKDSEESEDRNTMDDSKAPTMRKKHAANHEEGITPNVDLYQLSAEKQSVARKMLYEERDAFARNEDDVGCIPDLMMNINLTDTRPVQKNYTAFHAPCILRSSITWKTYSTDTSFVSPSHLIPTALFV